MKKLPWPRLDKEGNLIIPPTGIPGFRLRIKQVHIDEGTRLSSVSCMEALPLREMGFSSISVTTEHIRGNRDHIRYDWLHPAKGPVRLKIWDDEEEARKAAEARGERFVSKVKPYSLMLRGATATCAPVVKRGPLKVPRTKHPTRGKKLKKGSRRTIRRYHGIRIIETPGS